VDAERVPRRRRKEIDDQGVNPRAQEIDGFLYKVAQRRAAVFVSGRNDFNYRNGPAEVVLDYNPASPVGVKVIGSAANDARTRSLHRRFPLNAPDLFAAQWPVHPTSKVRSAAQRAPKHLWVACRHSVHRRFECTNSDEKV
jgi:hypothetical protein